MRRSRRLTTKKSSYTEENLSENERNPKKAKTSTKNSHKIKDLSPESEDKTTPSRPKKQKNKKKIQNDGSSSESDIEAYLHAPDKIDLNSDFFQIKTQLNKDDTFDVIEKCIFSGINRLSGSDSDNEMENDTFANGNEKENISNDTGIVETQRNSFHQIQEYTRKLEEAKKVVQKYEASKRKKQVKQKLSLSKQTKEETLNVSQLLALGEKKIDSANSSGSSLQQNGYESLSDSEKDDWEEVKEHNKETKNIIPKHDIEVTVGLPVVMRKKKGVDLMASIKRRLNRMRKENQLLVHKVHILCWIAHGNIINKTLNNKTVLAMALSIIPSNLCNLVQPLNLSYLEKIVAWYQDTITNIEKPVSESISLVQLLKMQISSRQSFNKTMLVYMFICILRSLGIECRLVLSFQVAPLRPPDSELHSLSNTNNKNKLKTKINKKARQDSSSDIDENEIQDITNDQAKVNHNGNLKEKRQAKNKKQTIVGQNAVDEEKCRNLHKRENNVKTRAAKPDEKSTKEKLKVYRKETQEKSIDKNLEKSKSSVPRKSVRTSRQIPQLDGATDIDILSDSNQKTRSNKTQTRRTKSVPAYKEVSDDDSEDDFDTSRKGKRNSRTNNNNVQNKLKSKKGKMIGKNSSSKTENDDDSDYTPDAVFNKQDDSEVEYFETPTINPKSKLKIKKKFTPKLPRDKKGIDLWVEVYSKTDEKWISIDIVRGQVDCINELYSRASHPVTYIVGWNNCNKIKDVTQRYYPNRITVIRHLRIDNKWWDSSLKPFQGEAMELDKKEDEEFTRTLLEDRPTAISEYKNHPLFALKRHLLKFQALYPPEPIILGYIRNEPIYPRSCVYTLHSRDIWIKQAKVVKPGEKPYKVVTRTIWDKVNKAVLKDQPLEIFGEWQVQDYEPPTAKNGIVPRNEYGNVDLFKPCMLPKGTVHIRLEGLSKVARKMRIDCATAIIGFDVHHGWIHPVYDGYVVCEENAEVLIAAWHMEQEEQEQREIEKREKRVYGNWKKLIKGLLIRQKLNIKYNFKDLSNESAAEMSIKRLKLEEPRVQLKKCRSNKK